MNTIHLILSSIDWGTLAAWVAAVVAITALIADHRRFRLSQSVELLIKFEDKFETPRLLEMRRKAARAYKRGNFNEVDDLLDQLETIGLLAERKVLDYEMIWCSFGYWIIMYAHVWNNYIKKSQKDDPTVWTYFVILTDKIKSMELKTRGALTNPKKEDVENFIKYEMALKSD